MTFRRILSVLWNKSFLTERDWGIKWRGKDLKMATFPGNLIIKGNKYGMVE